MKSLASFLFVALLSGSAAAQPAPTAPAPAPVATPTGEILTLDRAVQIALEQQPSLRQSRAQLEAAYGRVDQAQVARRPTISLSAQGAVGSSRGNAATGSSGGFFTADFSSGLSAQASWKIYDFGQTAINIRAAELNAEATAAGIGTTTLDIRTNVELAYLEAVARGRLVEVAQTTVKSEETHLDQARKFVAAQAKDPIEVAQAQARAANARSALAQAQSQQAIALANLRSAIGWLDASRSPGVGNEWPTPPTDEPPALTTLVDSSRSHRPELVAADREIAAAEANLDAALAERRPTLSAVASTQWNPDTSDPSPEPSWTAALTLSWQLYDGGRSKADARVARANVTGVQAQRDALLLSLTTQLDSARSQILANRAAVSASNEAVTAAKAQLQLAEARYAQGLGSQIELADAQTAVTTASGNLVQSEWQLADAWTSLRRATGSTR